MPPSSLAAAQLPLRHSAQRFWRCFGRCRGVYVRFPPQGAPTAPQPASACWARWLPSLRARSGPPEPTARRLFGCGSGPVSQPEIRACRARRPGRRGAAERGSGKARAGNLPRLPTPRAGVALVAPLRTRIPPLCPALVQLTNDRCNPVRRRQPRRRCPQRVAGGAGVPVRVPLDVGSGLPSARRESSTRAAARPSASAGSLIICAGNTCTPAPRSASAVRPQRAALGRFALPTR